MRRSASCFAKTDVDLLVLPASVYEQAFLVGGPRELALDRDTVSFLSAVSCMRDWPLACLPDALTDGKFVAVFFRCALAPAAQLSTVGQSTVCSLFTSAQRMRAGAAR